MSDTNDTLAKNSKKMALFVENLKTSGNVLFSCLAAGIARRTAYRWRKKWKTFANQWEEALEDACDLLEGEAWNRAIKSSDRLLMFLLKAHRPERFKDRQAVDVRIMPEVKIYIPDNERDDRSTTGPAD